MEFRPPNRSLRWGRVAIRNRWTAFGVVLALLSLIAGCGCAPARPTTTTQPTGVGAKYRLEDCVDGITFTEAMSDYDGNALIQPGDFPEISVEHQLVGCSPAKNGMTDAIGLVRLTPPSPSGHRPVVLAGPGFCLNNNPFATLPVIEGMLAEGRQVVVAYYALRNFDDPPDGVHIPITMNDSMPAVASTLQTSSSSMATLLNAVGEQDTDYDLIGSSCGSLIALNAFAGGTVDRLPMAAVLINGGSQIAGIGWDPPPGLGDRLWVLAGEHDALMPGTSASDAEHPFAAGDPATGPDPRKRDRGHVVGNTQDVCAVLDITACTIDPESGHNLPDELAVSTLINAGLLPAGWTP